MDTVLAKEPHWSWFLKLRYYSSGQTTTIMSLNISLVGLRAMWIGTQTCQNAAK